MPTKKETKKIIILDSHAIIHRAYHALPDFSSSKGEATGALYGLSSMLISIIKEFKPYAIFAAFDLPKPTYRHDAYSDYKTGRKELDDNLVKQLNRARDVFKAFDIPIFQAEGFEADDIIGTFVKKLSKKDDVEVIIASGDMDTLQLVDGKKVKVYTLKKGIKDTILYDEKAVKDRFGFKPEMLPDFKGLRGDPSDNIIGIAGIGEKTATDLITNFGTIEDIYKKLKKDEESFIKKGIKPRIINLLKENKDEAVFSKMLATIRRDAPLNFEIPKKSWIENVSIKNIRDLFQELEFRSILSRVEELLGQNGDDHEEEEVDTLDLKELAVAVWLIDSSITNPSKQDILHFARKDNFVDAKNIIEERLKKDNLWNLYQEIEKPLVMIIHKMEENGIKIDVEFLKKLSKEYRFELADLEKSIYKDAGREFNVNSPKQLAEVLFNDMQLKYSGMRRTGSGQYSTKEEVLEKLADEHLIAKKLLRYRELHKLVSTYIDTIPKNLDKNNRLHAHFLQTGTTTGRMSSQNPNLQNIPIKTEDGRKIRNAFIVEKGNRMLALDYSQIELRLAAILSGDEKLIDIFKSGRDVHAEVASEVFNIPYEDVTKEMRNKAKVINFGILYGMGVGALQKNLNTTRAEAQKFYDDYFNTFTTLASYLENVKKETAKNGYTTTLFGRRRYFEGIKSSVPFIRASAERMAINAPIQGTQADIIKKAMVLIDKSLNDNDVKLLLQIHDEVVYEVPEDKVEKVSKEMKKIMESILTKEETKGVPIIANAYSGKSFGQLLSLE